MRVGGLEVACTKCKWHGDHKECFWDGEDYTCPECKSFVEDIDMFYDNELFGEDFNWNKK